MTDHALVTGAFGFVGRHTCRALAAEGLRVVGIGHGSWDKEEQKTWGVSKCYTADISLDSLLEYAGRPKLLIHCAGSGSVNYSILNPLGDYQRTVDTTAAVLEYIRTRSEDTVLVLPSSAGVYGNLPGWPYKRLKAFTAYLSI